MAVRKYDYIYSIRRKRIRQIASIALLVVLLFFIYELVTSFLFSTKTVSGDSMLPTFSAHSRILVSPFAASVKKNQRGALVLVHMPNSKRPRFSLRVVNAFVRFFTLQLYQPFQKKTSVEVHQAVRRVIGLPGDTVYMRDFICYVKPAGAQHFLTEFELRDVDYDILMPTLPTNWSDDLPFSGNYPEIILGEREYFLLSDNRVASNDSRMWGVLDGSKHIDSGVLLQYWPIKKWRRF